MFYNINFAAGRHFTLLAGLVLLPAFSASAADTYKIDISLDTGPNHVRNISVEEFARELNTKSNGRLRIKVFHGASKYKGTNVPTALAQGALDMGLPGTWHVTKFLPDFNAPGLPVLYGVRRKAQYAIWDGKLGQELNRKLEKKLNVKVLGRWIDLGFGQMFFTKKHVQNHADLANLKIRAPGGAANIARYKTFGASAISIPFPDVAQALQRNTVDGVLTTYESVRSAKLWDAGLKYTYDDFQVFFQYIPMMSRRAWDALPADLQKLVTDSWDAKVNAMRSLAEKRQGSAKKDAVSNGMTRTIAKEKDLTAIKAKLLAGQDQLVKALRMDAAFVARLVEATPK